MDLQSLRRLKLKLSGHEDRRPLVGDTCFRPFQKIRGPMQNGENGRGSQAGLPRWIVRTPGLSLTALKIVGAPHLESSHAEDL